MINLSDANDDTIGALIEWTEQPIALEYFFPKVQELRNAYLAQLVGEVNDLNRANILRGKISMAEEFLSIHDQLQVARKTENA